MAINDIFRLAVEGRGPQDQQLVNTLYFKQNTLTIFDTPSEDLAQAYDIAAVQSGLFTALFHANNSVVSLSVRGITDPDVGFDFLYPTPVPGDGTGDMLPPISSCVVTWNTGFIGRAKRGRNYIWPTSEANQSQGVFGSGYLTGVSAYADAIQEMGDGIVTASWTHVVWSGTLTEAFDVISSTPRAIVNNQTRRKPGVGR